MTQQPNQSGRVKRLIRRISVFILLPSVLFLAGFAVIFGVFFTKLGGRMDGASTIDDRYTLGPGDELALHLVHSGREMGASALREAYDEAQITADHPGVTVTFEPGGYSEAGSNVAQQIGLIENTAAASVTFPLRVTGPPGAEYSVSEPFGLGWILTLIIGSTLFNLLMVLWAGFGSVYVLTVSIKEWSA